MPGVPRGLSPAIKLSKLHGHFPTQTIKVINTIQTFPNSWINKRMKGVGGKMRSDNNKPWGTHRTMEIPPTQLEPRDPSRVKLLSSPQNPRGFTHRNRHSNSLAFPPPFCEWSTRQTRPRCAALSPTRLMWAVEGMEIAPCRDTRAASSPSLCASRAHHRDAGFGASAMKHSEIKMSAHRWLQQEWNGTQFHS